MPTYTVRLSDGSTQTIDSDSPPQLGAPLTAPVQGGLSPQIPTQAPTRGISSIAGGIQGGLRVQKPMSAADTLAYAQALGVTPSGVPAAIAGGVNPASVSAQKTTFETQAKLAPRLRTIANAIPRIEAASARVNTEGSAYAQVRKYGSFAALRGKNPDIAELQTFRALRSSLSRLTGEVGNLSEGEQKAVEEAFIPIWTDSKAVADAKLIAIKNFMADIGSSDDPSALVKEVAGLGDGRAITELYNQQGQQQPQQQQIPQGAGQGMSQMLGQAQAQPQSGFQGLRLPANFGARVNTQTGIPGLLRR